MTDVRLVTATNCDLAAMVRAGTFRQDLYMRLNVVQLRVPSLREHIEDVGAIADSWWFRRFRKHLAAEQIAALKTYSYPGNVRGLLGGCCPRCGSKKASMEMTRRHPLLFDGPRRMRSRCNRCHHTWELALPSGV